MKDKLETKENEILGTPGPFQVIETQGIGDVDSPIDAPRRRYDCQNYDTCLELAAALNWDNFTCRGCDNTMNQSYIWRARQAARKDDVAGSLCEHLPQINVHETDCGKNDSHSNTTKLISTKIRKA
jgi:hypothetical protein